MKKQKNRPTISGRPFDSARISECFESVLFQGI